MTTEVLSTDAGIDVAVDLLKKENVVALPTETVYGLAADAFSAKAVAAIFAAKKRPLSDPLIVHLLDVSWVERVAIIPPEQHEMIMALAKAFWPGPLTLLLPRSAAVPDLVTAGLETVAVRIPSHSIIREVLAKLDAPLAAPSANSFGRISPTSAADVLAELNGEIPLILDGGCSSHGLESTILWPHDGVLQILRPGPITVEMLATFGKVIAQPIDGKAPGSLKSHYAPGKKLRWYEPENLLSQSTEAATGFVAPVLGASRISNTLSSCAPPTPCPSSASATLKTGSETMPQKNVGLLAFSKKRDGFGAVEILTASGDLCEAACNLYAALRRLDESHVTSLVVERVPEEGIGSAIMDRLRRAVSYS